MRKVAFFGSSALAQSCLQEITKQTWQNRLDVVLLVSNNKFWTGALSTGLINGNCSFLSDETRPEGLEGLLAEHSADVLISVQHRWVFSADVIGFVNGYAFNFHNAKLPEYRGYNGVSHEIINGESTHSMTIHWVTADVDEGPICCEYRVAIDSEETALSLYRKCLDVAPNFFHCFLEMLTLDKIPKIEQKGQGRFFKSKDLAQLCDISGVRNQVVRSRTVRGCYFPPLQTAYSFVGGVHTLEMPASSHVWDLGAMQPANQPKWG